MPGQAQKTDKKTTKTPAAAPSSSSTAAKGGDEAQEKLGNAAVKDLIAVQSAGETNWKDAYGDKIGGAAWKQIAKHVTDEKVGELATKGAESLYGKVHDLSMEHLSPGTDPDKAEQALSALHDELVPLAGTKAEESGLGTKARELIGEHPYAAGGALLAGAAAYIATNQDLPLIEGKKKLGENHTIKAGIDPGRTLDLKVEEAKLGYEYANAKKGLEANLVGDWKKDDGYDIKGGIEKKLDSGALASLKGEHVERKDDRHSRLDLAYTDPNWAAKAYLEQTRNGQKVDTVGGSVDWHDATTRAGLSGKASPQVGWDAKGYFERDLDPGETLRLAGEHSENKLGDSKSKLDLSYVNPNLTADVYWQRTRGDKTVDALGGSIANVPQDAKDIQAYLRGEYRTDGSYTAAGGLTQELDDKSWSLEGYAGRDATGRSDSGVRAMFKWRF